MFEGAITAHVTPFKNGEVDYKKLEELLEFQIAEGIHGILPCGTTGESATLSHEEHKQVVKKTVEIVNKRVPVIAGAGSNSTAEAVELTKWAKKIGAQGALVITPYYNKPTQEGLYQHFKKVAEEVNIPIVLYNVPGRTGVNLLPATLARLKDISNIVAVKEASGNFSQIEEIKYLCGNKVTLLSGDDSLYFPLLAIGGKGVISVLSNILPGKWARVYDLYKKGKLEESQKLFFELFPLTKSIFIETNPIPIKTSLKMMGKLNGQMRLPLVPMSRENEEKLKNDLKRHKVI
ncbi:MAG: 4-hydroxy-tetrahydrodipicolinate synthase [Spirochaetes bacterium]|nr:4-hydroxy-tetrahydrodipicolinate synthase [Spirochaetota bacterium]